MIFRKRKEGFSVSMYGPVYLYLTGVLKEIQKRGLKISREQ